ncbi:MAG: oxidoreductase [candidate division KSB1 bacterium]|nr:oxidoreductase [candidate division KSB1 bacterium]
MVASALVVGGCAKRGAQMRFTGAQGEVKLITLDPGHFHAALVQKTMYPQIDPVVRVFAPAGPDLDDHLSRIQGFNTRTQDPTHWVEKVYTGPDYLERMLREKPGNVVVLAGNNQRKPRYIKACVDAGLNVLSDKPMCINSEGFALLKAAFRSAAEKGVLLYDIMTERYEITTILQRELVHMPEVFGELQAGSPDDPAVTKESVHHLFKYVAGVPVKRPAWYFDVEQQGEGIVDVSTHLVDLVMWECFPEQPIDTTDIEVLRARHWPTLITREQFEKVTRLPDFPDFLKSQLDPNGALPYYCNGEMIYRIRGIYAKVSVIWNFEAPPGGGDTHYSVMKGSRSYVVIQQGKEENYRPELYVLPAPGVNPDELSTPLANAVQKLQEKWPGVALEKQGQRWHILVPDVYRVGHEAHFAQVTEKYLRFLVEGKLPDWEVPNMIAKYYTTTRALELARRSE